jgi:hypothetical protein
MRKGMMILALLAALGVGGKALACSSHGTTAGNSADSWMDDHNSNGQFNGISVSGTQWVDHSHHSGEDGHWNANDWYQVTITYPPGFNPHTQTFTADPTNFSGGAAVEAWLESQAVAAMQAAAPPDAPGDDYIG